MFNSFFVFATDDDIHVHVEKAWTNEREMKQTNKERNDSVRYYGCYQKISRK